MRAHIPRPHPGQDRSLRGRSTSEDQDAGNFLAARNSRRRCPREHSGAEAARPNQDRRLATTRAGRGFGGESATGDRRTLPRNHFVRLRLPLPERAADLAQGTIAVSPSGSKPPFASSEDAVASLGTFRRNPATRKTLKRSTKTAEAIFVLWDALHPCPVGVVAWRGSAAGSTSMRSAGGRDRLGRRASPSLALRRSRPVVAVFDGVFPQAETA